MSVEPATASHPSCPDCQSVEVRPSKSSYPLDAKRRAAGTDAFWRCGNCGTRFLGPAPPPVPERRYRPHRRPTDPFKSALTAGTGMTRFVVPLLLLTVTLLGVIVVLLLRDPEALIK